MTSADEKRGLHNDNLIAELEAIKKGLRYLSLADGGLAIGSGSKKKVLFANSLVVSHNGIPRTITTAEVAFTATTDDIAPDANLVQEAIYLMEVDSAGTVSLHMGDIADGAGNAVWPTPTANKVVVGAVRIAVAAGSTLFNATTDDLDAGHLTVTYYDVVGSIVPLFTETL